MARRPVSARLSVSARHADRLRFAHRAIARRMRHPVRPALFVETGSFAEIEWHAALSRQNPQSQRRAAAAMSIPPQAGARASDDADLWMVTDAVVTCATMPT
ncbi:hypothetical protein [Microbacterium sp. SLBN-146]|uniref:hypothetical protein n=1 Tax=Microbacterium sp. SLBN-146 TaxID=2768457 RepID=UPI0011501A5E|nr:hypothetical protein [Microbacterium sp. SLBN-146]